jgi:hypothetical protein
VEPFGGKGRQLVEKVGGGGGGMWKGGTSKAVAPPVSVNDL